MRHMGMSLAAICLCLAIAGSTMAEPYTIDPAHTQITFKVKHLGITNVSGSFGIFSGNFEFDPKAFEKGTASATIDVSSINTGVEQRDNHLRSADFFDVEKHPKMTFKSTKIQGIEGSSFELVGDLTIRGVTKPVTLEVDFDGTATDPFGNEKAAFTASTTINRKDFGMTWNKALEAGGLLVSDEVRILLEVQGNKVKG